MRQMGDGRKYKGGEGGVHLNREKVDGERRRQGTRNSA